MQANNEYVEPVDPHSDKLEGDDWINSTHVEHITFVFKRSNAPTGTKDLKVGDIFESKVKLLQVITEWSIQCRVSSCL